MQRSFRVIALGFVLACSGDKGTSAPATPANAAEPTEPAPEPAKEDPEASEVAAKVLNAVEQAVDADQRGRIAASGLADPQFGLGPDVRKVLDALAQESIDPSQAAAIIAALFDEDAAAGDAFGEACGVAWAKIGPELKKLPPTKRTDRIVDQCKVDAQRLGDPKIRGKLNFASVALSVTVEKLLEKRGAISQAERGVAAHLATLKLAP